jgi:hypothetical protein
MTLDVLRDPSHHTGRIAEQNVVQLRLSSDHPESIVRECLP